MNTAPDDLTLMAYADGQLDAAARREVERAVTADPALAARVQQHQALARRLAAAYAPVLDEPLPSRFQPWLQAPVDATAAGGVAPAADPAAAPVGAPAGAPVADLAAARAARQAASPVAPKTAPAPRAWDGWARWGGMAASLALGLVLGQQWRGDAAPGAVTASAPELLATGAVAQALQTQPAGAGAAAVGVSFSFVDREGRYCRTFTTAAQGGLACREAGGWAVMALAPAVAPAAAPAGALRQASTALPAAVLQAVDERMAGTALDAAAEAAALQKGWAR